jgi:hypothetical protein
MTKDHSDLALRLDSIAEELTDRTMADLREALEHGARPVDEKRLLAARRAVEKAARLLRGGSADTEEGA